jgi:hypothetical protein
MRPPRMDNFVGYTIKHTFFVGDEGNP